MIPGQDKRATHTLLGMPKKCKMGGGYTYVVPIKDVCSTCPDARLGIEGRVGHKPIGVRLRDNGVRSDSGNSCLFNPTPRPLPRKR